MKLFLNSLIIVTFLTTSVFAQERPGGTLKRAIPSPDGRPAKLKPGQFEWHPERSPKGPLLVVCSIDDQMLYVYRNGIQIARSTVSTGRKGKRTPTGVFTVLQRKIDHESNIYKGAKMPYMQRLTWSGIAMHAGKLPGYPASAGCIRMPYEFSKRIYGEMKSGSTVVITQKRSIPSKSASPADILMEGTALSLTQRATPIGKVMWNPRSSPHGPISILLSYGDQTIYVWRNGILIGQSPVGFNSKDQALPEGVFLMLEGKEKPLAKYPGIDIHPWSILSLESGSVKGDIIAYMRDNFSLPTNFRAAVNQELTPGTIFLATKDSSTAATRSGPMAIGVPDKVPMGKKK